MRNPPSDRSTGRSLSARGFVAIAAAMLAADVLAHDDDLRIGVAGDRAAVTRTITVDMGDDMRFSPSRIVVKRGETIRFVVRNNGQARHEMVLGTRAALKEHAALMRRFPEMEHADPNQVTVEPGKTGELVWRFTKGGTVEFACLQPGHFEAGMRGSVAVRQAK